MALIDEIKLRKKIVRETLKLLHSLSSQRISDSDYRASIIFMDFKTAFMNSELTERQVDVINYLYVEDLPREDVADKMNVSRRMLYYTEEEAIEEIAKHLKGV